MMAAPTTWAEKSQAIEDAFRKLPMYEPPKNSPGIPPEYFLPGIVRELLLMARFKTRAENAPEEPLIPAKTAPDDSFIPAETAPEEAPMPAKKPPKKSLTAVVKSTKQLLADLYSLPPVAEEALGFRPGKLHELTVQLTVLKGSAEHPLPYKKEGAPKKIQPRKIAETIGLRYFMLTGKKPTVPKRQGVPYGPFLELVKTVFQILEVEASPASQADYVYDNWALIWRKAKGKNRS